MPVKQCNVIGRPSSAAYPSVSSYGNLNGNGEPMGNLQEQMDRVFSTVCISF